MTEQICGQRAESREASQVGWILHVPSDDMALKIATH